MLMELIMAIAALCPQSEGYYKSADLNALQCQQYYIQCVKEKDRTSSCICPEQSLQQCILERPNPTGSRK